MFESLFTPASQLLKGNTPLLLAQRDRVWRVESGAVSLFATALDEQNEPKGTRRYLFTLEAGEVLFDVPLLPTGNEREQRGVIAVAAQETELTAFTIADFTAKMAADPDLGIWVEGWIQHWNGWFKQYPLTEIESAGKTIQATSRYFPLFPQQVLQAPAGQVQWIRIQQGRVSWLGFDLLNLEVNSPLFPLTSETWLVAENQVEVESVPLEEIDLEHEFSESLARFHTYGLTYINQLEQIDLESEFQRFQERERLNHQITVGAMQELVSTLEPAGTMPLQEGSFLLVAAGAVGHALGIPVRPPAASEDVKRLRDPLDAIARASKFRTRQVKLVGNWWQKENGSLLAYTQDNQPVALLQVRGNRYELFDPITLQRTLVTDEIANTLSSDAYMFYRALPETLTRISDILSFAVRGHIPDLIIVVSMGILGSLLGMVVPQATNLLISDAIPSGDREIVWQLGLGLFAAACGKAAFEMTRGLASIRVENAADLTLQTAVWDRLLQLPPAFFRQYNTGDLLLRMLTISQIRAQLSGATQRTLLNAVFALLNLALMFIYSVKLAFVGICITIVISILTSVSSLLMVRKTRKKEALDGKLNGLNVELINGVAKLRVAAAENRAFGAWTKLFSQRIRLLAGIQRIDNSVTVLTEALPVLSSVLIYWFALSFIEAAQKEGIQGLTLGTFMAFNSAYGTFLGGVNDLSNTVTDLLNIVPLWERAEPIVKGKPEADLTKADPGRLRGAIALDHIAFRYREDGPMILDDVSLTVEPGEFVALVGASGSGKSTLLRLILGFEQASAGTVFYDGQDLAGLDVQAVRRQLGVVLQNGRIGAGSISESITGGALVSLEQVWEAAEMAGFAEDIQNMPMGMHTVVSEGGLNLSGGQRQRLLIARAIVLKPKIILFDEATSALDNRTQAIVTESLDRLNASRIVVAHRLSTIRNADRIYVMEAGRIVQVGTFDELVNQDGLFARLAARQLD